ncbi:MAG: hypothetical protein QG646_255 [Euryarchaeota archaeon]|nr:hypothetical protein [Euryarchaeota archaeon]
MIVLCFSIGIYIVNSKVNRDYSVIRRPDNGFKIDAIYNLMMFSTPLSINKINMLGIRFIKNSIIDNKKTSFRTNKPFYFFS